MGHQPYGHDTIATMYNRYKVLGCRVQLVFTTPGGANDMICCMAPSSHVEWNDGLQLYQVQEWPQSVCGILPVQVNMTLRAASDVRHGDDRWREQGSVSG